MIPPEVVAALPPDLQAQIPLYDENLQPNLYVSDGICLVAAITAVTLRLYSRRLKGQHLGWDDYMIIVALVSFHTASMFLPVDAAMARNTNRGLHAVT